jgi:hypothetical protein
MALRRKFIEIEAPLLSQSIEIAETEKKPEGKIRRMLGL